MLRRPLLYLLLLLLLNAALSASAQNTPSHQINIRPTRFIATAAIPDFDPVPASEVVKADTFSGIIYKDLELSGFFTRPDNLKIVNDVHRSDVRSGKIDFQEWIRTGASFVLKSTYSLTGNDLWAECHLYEVRSGQRIFARKFTGFTRADHRRMCHLIADEIIRYVAHEPGIASTRIVFISQRGQAKELFVMDADGQNQRPLTQDGNLAATPCWGYKGEEVYYTSYREHNPDLWVVRLADNKAGVISSQAGFNLSPSWCEKNGRIALTLSKDGNSEIYTMDRRGGGLKRLTFHKAIDAAPSWSPDGSRIIFTSDRGGSPQLYMMDSEGLNVRRITHQGSYNESAVWSPKGDKIAFVSRARGTFQIFIMNQDGSGIQQLTSPPGNNEDPTWAADGRRLCFTSDRTGKPQIFVMLDDGTGVTQLTFEGRNQSSSWSPFME